MEAMNYKGFFCLFTIVLLNASCSFSTGDRRGLDSFVSRYFPRPIQDSIITFTYSPAQGMRSKNKRVETDAYTYYYGKLYTDVFFEDHLKNIISSERKELWALLPEFSHYERFDLDSNQVFHEVIINNLLIGYYLKNDSLGPKVENAFGEFLMAEFGYKVASEFPSNIYE